MFGLQLYASSAGQMFADYSSRASQLVVTNGEHGFSTLNCFVRMSLAESFQLFERPGTPHVQISEFGLQVWAGRLEDVAIVAGGVNITALGYWRALTDNPYITVWSSTRVSDWEILKTGDEATVYSDRYALDTNNRLYITAQKNATVGNTTVNKAGIMGYRGLNNGSRQIVAWSFTYDLTAPVTWKAYLQDASAVWVRNTTLWSLAGNGAQQTGTASGTFAGNDALMFMLRYEAADATVGAETGGIYLKITNIRVMTTTSAALYADEIAKDLVAATVSANSGQLASTTALIKSPTVDLTDEVYWGLLPADILDRLAFLGDNSSPVALYETGVWDNQILSFQKRGLTARVYYVDISALELERTINALFNSAYATYQEANGHPVRTGSSTDSNSAARYGLTRKRAIPANTTSSTEATAARDAAVQDGKDPRPRIKIAFDRVYDSSGSAYPLWMVRAWDTIVIRNLPLTLSASLDRIRQFRVIEARYDVDKNVLTVTPEQFVPSLAVLTARNAAGIRR